MSIDSYEIGVSLILNDKIVGTLGGVQEQFTAIQEAIKKSNDMLRDMGGLVGSLAGSSRTMASAWSKAANAAERMAAAARSIGIPAAPPFGGGGQQPPGSPPSNTMFFPSGDGGGPTGNTGFTMVDDPNQLRLGAPGAGIPMSGYNNRPGNNGGGNGFSPMHLMSGIFTGYYGAQVVGDSVKAIASPSFEVADQLNNIRNLTPKGQSADNAINAAMAAAIQIQENPANPGITIGQALSLIANTYSVDRDMNTVSAIAPGMAADAYRMSRVQGGAIDIDTMYTLLRSSEELGKLNLKKPDGSIDTSKALSFMDQVARLVVNSNGNLTASGILTMVGQMGPGGTALSDDALSQAIISQQALGNSQVGSGMNAFTQQLIGGKMSQATAHAMYDAGVLPKYAMLNGKITEMFGDDGKITKPFKYGPFNVMLPPGTLKDENLALTNPLEWIKKDLLGKYLNSDGSVKPGDQNKEDLIAALNRDFSRIPGMKLAGLSIFNAIIQERALQNAAFISANVDLSKNDASTPNAQAAGFSAALNGMIIALTNPLLPDATKILHGLTGAMDSISDAARAHPTITHDIDRGAVATAVIGAGAAIKWGVTAILKKMGLSVGSAAVDATFAGGEAAEPAGGGLVALIGLAVAAAIANAGPGPKNGGRSYGEGSNRPTPAFTHADPGIVVVQNATSILSPSPTMPNGPTAPNSALISRHPGQVNRLTGAP